MKRVRKLNLGCGKDIMKDCINLDMINLEGVDIIADIEKPLPFKNDYFDVIYCYDVLEHVDNFMGLMDELHRISKRGARILIKSPHFSFFTSYADPTHKRFFSAESFNYFTESCDFGFYTKTRFKIIKKKIVFYWINNKKRQIKSEIITFMINAWPIFYERFICWIIPANMVYFELEVDK